MWSISRSPRGKNTRTSAHMRNPSAAKEENVAKAKKIPPTIQAKAVGTTSAEIVTVIIPSGRRLFLIHDQSFFMAPSLSLPTKPFLGAKVKCRKWAKKESPVPCLYLCAYSRQVSPLRARCSYRLFPDTSLRAPSPQLRDRHSNRNRRLETECGH